MSRITAPKGTKDLFYPEIFKWQFLEEKVRQYFSRFLYNEIRTPIFEHSELFYKGTGSETEVVQKEMYTFKDKASRDLTLRPENTPSVVRAALENNLFNELYPLRFYYIGPMFRYDKPQKGRFRQFHQFGIEVFGDGSAEMDAEIIFAAQGFLKHIDIQQINLHINSVGCRDCRPGFLNQLEKAAEKKKEKLCEDCQRKVHTNPLRIFDCKNTECIKISDQFPRIIDFLCPICSTHFEDVKKTLALTEVEYSVNSRLVRGLDYYTRTVFEITSTKLGAQDALLGGGRYDYLVQELGGADLQATGFAAGMERIILHLGQTISPEGKIIFIAYQNSSIRKEAIQIAKLLWENGIRTLIDYQAKNFKKQFKKGDRIGADYTFILGEEEINNQTVSIKNMKTQEQISIKREALNQWLAENN
jgi:histidyl-tRNA synthetase